MQEKGALKNWKMKFTKDNCLILLLLGVLLMIIVWPMEKTDTKTKSESGQWDSEADILKLQSDSIQNVGNDQGTGGEDALRSYASFLEKSLEELLGTMDGVGEVRVMVTLESSGEAIVEKDTTTDRDGSTEVDSAGGSRNTTNISSSEETVYLNGQGSGGAPYVRKVLSPKVEGVAVSAQGGGNIKTVQNITEAIQALFGLEAHKIKIVKMKSQ